MPFPMYAWNTITESFSAGFRASTPAYCWHTVVWPQHGLAVVRGRSPAAGWRPQDLDLRSALDLKTKTCWFGTPVASRKAAQRSRPGPVVRAVRVPCHDGLRMGMRRSRRGTAMRADDRSPVEAGRRGRIAARNPRWDTASCRGLHCEMLHSSGIQAGTVGGECGEIDKRSARCGPMG